MLYIMENGGTAEIGIAGNNGLIGYALFMGGETTSSRAMVQIAGEAVRLKADEAKKAFAAGWSFSSTAFALHTVSHHTDLSDGRL